MYPAENCCWIAAEQLRGAAERARVDRKSNKTAQQARIAADVAAQKAVSRGRRDADASDAADEDSEPSHKLLPQQQLQCPATQNLSPAELEALEAQVRRDEKGQLTSIGSADHDTDFVSDPM